MSYSSRLSDEKQFEIFKFFARVLVSLILPHVVTTMNRTCFNLCSDFDVESLLAGLENYELQNVKTAQSLCSVPVLSAQSTGCRFNIQTSTVNINMYTNKK